MGDITLLSVASGYNLTSINANFTTLKNSINDDVLHLNGGNNVMAQDLDMNSNRILNLTAAVDAADPVRKAEFDAYLLSVSSLAVVPLQQARQTGNGSTTAFNAPSTAYQSEASFFIQVDGVTQRPATDYTCNASGNIDFTTAPPNQADIDIRLFQPTTTPFAVSLQITTKAANTINAGVVALGNYNYLEIDTAGAASTDDLDTITGGIFDGQIIIVKAADSARTVVCKDGTGNLRLAGDFSLDHADDRIQLMYDGTNFVELSRSSNA